MAEKRPFRAYSGENPFVFVSYSHKDSAAVYDIIDRMFQIGYNIWYDQGIPNNALLDMEIAGKIRRCEAFLVFLSPRSAASQYVRDKELPSAVKRKKRIIFVRLDAADTADYSALTGGAPIISPAEILSRLPASCRECDHREPQPIEVDVTVGIELITDKLNGFEYAVSDGGLIITNLIGSENEDEDDDPEFTEDIVVPARHNGFPVTGIAMSAFEETNMQSGDYNLSLRSVTLPDTITVLGEAAFCDSTIERINLPAFLTDIEVECFSGCEGLEHIDLPYGLKNIEFCAFYECACLEEIIIPETVTHIGTQAFDGCCALSKIVIPPGVTELDDDIFYGLFDEYDPEEDEEWEDGVRITCVKGSPAHRYCRKNDLPFELVSVEEMDGHMRPMREAYHARKRAVEAEDAEHARAAAVEAAARGAYACVLCDTADETRVRELTDQLAVQGYRLRHNDGLEASATVVLCLSRANAADGAFAARALAGGRPVFPLMLDVDVPLPEAFAGRFVIHSADMERGDLLNAIREHLNRCGCKGNPHSAADIRAQFGNPDWSYNLTTVESGASVIAVKRYTGKGGDVVVPGQILGATVTGLLYGVFAGLTDVRTVTIPDTVRSLDGDVFRDCAALERVRLPGGRFNVNYSLFKGCTALRELVIPSVDATLCRQFFEGCPADMVVYTPEGSTAWTLAAENGYARAVL